GHRATRNGARAAAQKPHGAEQPRRQGAETRTRPNSPDSRTGSNARWNDPTTGPAGARRGPPDGRGSTATHDGAPERWSRQAHGAEPRDGRARAIAAEGLASGQGARALRREGTALRQPQVGLLQLLDVDVLERDHSNVLDEPGGPIHVPHPGVGHPHLEVDLTRGVPYLHVDRIGQVEAPLGLHHIGELTDDVAVLAIQRELHLGLVLLEVLRAHPVAAPPSCLTSSKLPFWPTSDVSASNGSTAHAALRIDAALRCTRRGGVIPRCMPAMATFANDHRCSSH